MSHELSNGKIVTGKTPTIAHLYINFRAWSTLFALENEETLACWLRDDESKKHYLGTIERADKLAAAGFAKLGNVEMPDLSGF